MRVYELAKRLGVENRELIPELKKMGIPAASHSSTLDDDAVEKVIEKMMPKAKRPGRDLAKAHEVNAAEKKMISRSGAAVRKSRSPLRGIVQEPSKAILKSPTIAAGEPPKADKRQILVKRKRTEDEVSVAVTAAPPIPEFQGLSGMPPSEKAPIGPPSPAQAGIERAEPMLPPEAPSGETPLPDRQPDRSGSGQESQLRTSAPIELTGQAAASSEPPMSLAQVDERRPEKKKGVPAGPAVAEKVELKEKGKRAFRKSGRMRAEDEFNFREDAARWKDLRAIPVHRREERTRHSQPSSMAEITKPRKKVIKLPAGLTVKDFAELVGQRPTDVVKKLMQMGQMLTLNQPMNMDAAALIAEGLGLKTEVSAEKKGEALLGEAAEWEGEERLEQRPPVVTIMGHVDHGKTSLLDAIRQTKVTEQEAGGITQHIGAYTVLEHGKPITFLDTPGHEAFTAMRARGAQITDIVVLVVAADDGVMPQTVEAINHATAAHVPIVVAINKIDKPGANAERVKHALAEHSLIPEVWGGQTIFVEVSARQRLGLDSLLEMILLQAEVLELKADPYRLSKGTVLEAKLDRGRGPVATVLVRSGTLRTGDAFVVGAFSGRVRALLNDRGGKVEEAGPSMPVEVVGLPGVPAAGDAFVVVKDERVAREIAQVRMQKQRTAELAASSPRVTLDELYARIKEGDVKELVLIIKADAQGSAEALSEAVEKLSSQVVKLHVIHAGVGAITETDVLLASASGAIIIGFNIRPDPKAAALAERERVDIRLYSVIYDAIADIKAAQEGLFEPTLKERVLGRAEVRQLFTIPKVGVVAGCYVTDGAISRASAGARVVRDGVTVYEGKVGSLRRFKDDVREVQQGYECGISVENFNDLKIGDVIEAYTLDKVAIRL